MVSQVEAAREILRRRKARSGLIDFTRYTFEKYRPAEHHFVMAEKLEAVERGEIKRLMIRMPPRHGKSELASKRFPAKVLGGDPTKQFISASYNMDLAQDFSREVRNIVRSPEYSMLFPDVTIAKDSGAANRWHTNQGGGYAAAGIGTAVTGRGAHIFMIDDPVKDREAADSETQRRKAYEWYTSTAYTRLESSVDGFDENDPDAWLWDVGGALKDGLIKPYEGAIILVQTPWHEDDLSGRLITDMENGADQWEIVDMPATTESDTKALWPAKYPINRLMQIKKAIGDRDWNALYQLNPTPAEGTLFRREHLRYYSEIPQHLRIYGTSDYAVTDKGGDYTVHAVFGVDPDDNIYLLDIWRSQSETDTWVEAFLDLVQQWKPLMWGEESGQILKSIGPFLEKRIRERKAYVYRQQFTSVSDKVTRSRSILARVASGKFYLPLNADWVDDFIHELLAFPNSKNDDQVDTLSLLGRMLDKIVGGEKPKEQSNKPKYYTAAEAFMASGKKTDEDTRL